MSEVLLWFAVGWCGGCLVSMAYVSWFALIPGKWTASELVVFVVAFSLGWPLLLFAMLLYQVADRRENRMRERMDDE